MAIADIPATYFGDPLNLFVALDELLRRPAWQAQAACRGRTDVDFFPSKINGATPAKAYCQRCPVTAECYAFAVEFDAVGIWAGRGMGQQRHRSGPVVSSGHREPTPAVAVTSPAAIAQRMGPHELAE